MEVVHKKLRCLEGKLGEVFKELRDICIHKLRKNGLMEEGKYLIVMDIWTEEK